MRLAVWWLLLAGCDQTWNLDHVESVDATTFDPGAVCPPEYQLALYPGSRYRITSSTFAYWDVHDDCKDDRLGLTRLAAAQTREELDRLIASLRDSGIGDWWIGAVQTAGATSPEQRWIWITGEPIDTALWNSPEEPNDGDGTEDSIEQFGLIRGDRPGLIDYEGSGGRRALCECDGRPISAEANTAIELLRP